VALTGIVLLLFVERDVALAKLNKVSLERDEAVLKLDTAVADCERAIYELNVALAERDAAIVDRDRAVNERDIAIAERDQAKYDKDIAYAERDRVIYEQNRVISEHDRHVSERDVDASHARSSAQSIIKEMQARQVQLSQRVAYLEATNRNSAMLRVSQKPNKDKLKLIQKFAHLLSPELDNKMQQVNEIFDILFEKRKHFKKYVRAKLKVELRDIIRLETCREIKKFYAPWHILEVMDYSQQSLNQVSRLDSIVAFFTLCF